MGYLRIKCYYCGGTWEVYHRDLHSRYKKARECPHCFQKIDEQTWDNQIFPAYNALDDANRELFKDHLGYHVPLFEVSYESNTIFKNAKVEYGVVTWADGEIDIAPETMYENSYEYPEFQAQ